MDYIDGLYKALEIINSDIDKHPNYSTEQRAVHISLRVDIMSEILKELKGTCTTEIKERI